MVRGFSQLVQCQVVALARKQVVPLIEKRVEALKLPGVLVVKKVKSIGAPAAG